MSYESSFNNNLSGQSLSFEFSVALLVHLIIFVIMGFIVKLPDLNLLSKEEVEIPESIRNAVRVDVVAMPKHTLKELKSMKKSAPAKSESKSEELTLKKAEKNTVSKESASSFSNLLKQYSKKKVKKSNKGDSQSESTSIDSKSVSELKNLVVEGNKLSSGKSITGDTISSELSMFEKYAASLPDHVRQFWRLPSYLRDKGLSSKVQVFISKSGKLLKYKLYESSGDKEYDQSTLRAVKNAEPYPRPDADVARPLAAGKVVLSFPL